MALSKNQKLLWIAAIVGLVLFVVFTFAPTIAGDEPEAGRHVVDRQDAGAAAVQFVQDRLGGDATLEPFAMYAADRDVFGYFYKNELLENVLNRYQSTLPLEAYRVEVKNTDTGDIHQVDVNPYTGRVVEWNLRVETPSTELTAEKLEEQGQQAIRLLGLESLSPRLAESSPTELTYHLEDPAFGEAAAVLTVRAGESGPGRAQVQWVAPESYMKLIEKQDAWAEILGSAGLILSGALQLAAMIYALAQMKSVRWSRGAVMALVFGLFYCAINVNMYPGLKATMLGILEGGEYTAMLGGTEGTIASVVSVLLFTNAFTLSLAIGLYFSTVSGDTLAKRQGLALWPHPQEAGYGSHLAKAVWTGYLYAFILLGLQSVIFAAAQQTFRPWYTIDALSSSNNMVVPVLLPLLAWCAALSEEAVYRLFAIPAFKKLVRFTFPAVLLSSMIWALGHVQYPIYPYYTRFIEVTVLGLLFAYIFLKHGFLTAIFAHAVVDIIWMGISITSSMPTAANVGAFALYLAVPAIIAWTARLRHGVPPRSAA